MGAHKILYTAGQNFLEELVEIERNSYPDSDLITDLAKTYADDLAAGEGIDAGVAFAYLVDLANSWDDGGDITARGA